MASLLSELQFCQLENDALRERMKTLKMDTNSIRNEVVDFLKDKEQFGKLDDGSIILTKEDQQNLLHIIQKVIKTN
jgi:hypothetical protein